MLKIKTYPFMSYGFRFRGYLSVVTTAELYKNLKSAAEVWVISRAAIKGGKNAEAVYSLQRWR